MGKRKRKMPKYLKNGDYKLIAESTGYSRSTVSKMAQGHINMQPLVAEAINKLAEIRRKQMIQGLENDNVISQYIASKSCK